MRTLEELLKEGTARLKEAGVETPRLDAEVLLEAAVGVSRLDMYIRPSMMVEETEYLKLVKRRCAYCPVAYLTGKKAFMGLDFTVNENVLIPRPDTECLVEYALEHVLGTMSTPSVLDLCTGSGCIGLSIKHFRSDAAVTLTDLSEKALETAQKNALSLDLEVRCLHSDLFEAVTAVYDLIISNPPYIKEKEILTLQADIRDYEPRMALSGGESGLDIYCRIAEKAGAHLKDGGFILLEVGNGQATDVRRIFETQQFQFSHYIEDLSHTVRGVLMQKLAGTGSL